MELLIVQMAKLRGAVMGVTSSLAKGEAVKQAGADEVIIAARAGGYGTAQRAGKLW